MAATLRSNPLVCGTVFHLTSLLLHLSPPFTPSQILSLLSLLSQFLTLFHLFSVHAVICHFGHFNYFYIYIFFKFYIYFIHSNKLISFIILLEKNEKTNSK